MWKWHFFLVNDHSVMCQKKPQCYIPSSHHVPCFSSGKQNGLTLWVCCTNWFQYQPCLHTFWTQESISLSSRGGYFWSQRSYAMLKFNQEQGKPDKTGLKLNLAGYPKARQFYSQQKLPAMLLMWYLSPNYEITKSSVLLDSESFCKH